MNYQEYLKTEHWKKLRAKKRKRKKKRVCAICGYDKNLETHHLAYKNLYDVKSSDLRVLCRGCHSLVHLLMKEKKIVFRKSSHYYRFYYIKKMVRIYKKYDKYKDYWYRKRIREI